MRLRMTPDEFRTHMDGFGLALLFVGYGVCALLAISAASTLVGVRTPSLPPVAFEGLALAALGGGLRLLVRIDRRLEQASPSAASG